MSAAAIGQAIAASSNDRQAHGVIAVCMRCANENRRLSVAIQRKRNHRAADRALDDPEKFLCAVLPDIGAARLAVGLLGHAAHAQEALNALGWGSDTNHKI